MAEKSTNWWYLDNGKNALSGIPGEPIVPIGVDPTELDGQFYVSGVVLQDSMIAYLRRKNPKAIADFDAAYNALSDDEKARVDHILSSNVAGSTFQPDDDVTQNDKIQRKDNRAGVRTRKPRRILK